MSQLQVTGEAKIRDIQGPVVANDGVITALDGAASQYVRGDGTLADFPTSSGGGSSVSYYLNSSVSQGTIMGISFRELSKEPIIGTGTDITISADGYVASYITDVNDPDVLEVPGGNFNCEFYFSVNNNTGNPSTFAELYKYDGTNFTLLGSSVGVPEYINQGTIIAPYYFAIPVPTSALALTDRLAIRIYVNVDGRTVTLHTENGHLCQVVTTLSKGMVSLNNLTDQSQFITTGTSGTNFNIASSGDTHTFNLPIASATNTGKLSSTDWSTFNGKVPYTGATASVDLGIYSLIGGDLQADGAGSVAGFLYLKQNTLISQYLADYSAIGAYSNGYVFNIATPSVSKQALLDLSSITASATRTYTLPDLSGTLALLEGTQTFTGSKTFDEGISLKSAAFPTPATGYSSIGGNPFGITIITKQSSTIYTSNLGFPAANRTFTFPNADGTIALTSNLSSYVPYSGATTDVSLGNNSLLAKFVMIEGDGTFGGILSFKQYASSFTSTTDHTNIYATDTDKLNFNFFQVGGGKSFTFNVSGLTASANRTYTMPDASGTLALTSNLSAYLPLTGGTLTGALSGTSATFSSNITVNTVQVGSAGNTTNIKLGENTFSSLTSGSNNIAIGSNALSSITTSNANIGIGNSALASVINGTFNTGIGFAIGASITSGSYNALFGYGAGSSITTGVYNTILGGFAGTANMSNNIVLADGAGNVRYQWDGTNNVFGNPISGTSASFSSSVTASSFVKSGGTSSQFLKADGSTTTLTNIVTGTGTEGNIPVFTASGTIGNSTISEFEGGVNINNYLYSGLPYFSYDTSLAASFRITSNTNGNQVRLAFGTVSGVNNYSNIVTTIVDNSSNTKGRLDFQVRSGNNSFATPLTLEHTGNVGIGTSSPLTRFDCQTSATGTVTETAAFRDSSTNGNALQIFNGNNEARIRAVYYGTPSDQNITFWTITSGGSQGERMRITSGGNVGIGTNSPLHRLTIAAPSSAVDARGGAYIYSTDSMGANLGGQLFFGGSFTGTTETFWASIAGRKENGTDNNVAGYLAFATRPAGGSNTERMRITSGGAFKQTITGSYASSTDLTSEFNSNANLPALKLMQSRTSGNEEMLRMVYSNWSPNSSSAWFIYANDTTTARFYVTSNGGIGNFQANDVNLSDERTKKDIILLESYWDKFKAIEIVKFKYKDQTHDDFNIGVIAQQVELVAPEFVDIDGWNKPELDEEGNEIVTDEEPLKSIYSSDLHHATIKVLQEAMAKIEKLEAEIEELKELIKNK